MRKAPLLKGNGDVLVRASLRWRGLSHPLGRFYLLALTHRNYATCGERKTATCREEKSGQLAIETSTEGKHRHAGMPYSGRLPACGFCMSKVRRMPVVALPQPINPATRRTVWHIYTLPF